MDQPPAIIEQVKPEQWSVINDSLIREQVIIRRYRTDVMNFTGAAANAKSEAEAAEARAASLKEILKMLRAKLIEQGMKFTDDGWQYE